MLNGYSSLGGGECSLEADRIPSVQCQGELLKQKTGFAGITGDVADASANLLTQFNSAGATCRLIQQPLDILLLRGDVPTIDHRYKLMQEHCTNNYHKNFFRATCGSNLEQSIPPSIVKLIH